MGMFDTVFLKCAGCGEELAVQSKAGPCECEEYTMATAPLSILADIYDDKKYYDSELFCDKCGAQNEIQIQYIATVEKRRLIDG